MNGKWLAIFLGAAALFCTAAARADDGGYYLGGDIGRHALERVDTETSGIGRFWSWRTDSGFTGFARLGYAIAPDWRIELEGGYRPASINGIRAEVIPPPVMPLLVPVNGIALTNVGGHIDQTTLMANVLFDIPLGWRVQPYIGAGAGLVHTDVAAHGYFPFCPICDAVPICFPTCTINVAAGGSDDSIGVQAIGGISMVVDDRFTLDATYRYLRTDGVMWRSASGTVFSPGNFKSNLSDSTVTIGVRYAFTSFDMAN